MRHEVMSITVRYFAAAADAADCEEETLELPSSSVLGDLVALLVERYGAEMHRVLSSGSFLLDGIVRRDPAFALTTRVDVLPPFAGG